MEPLLSLETRIYSKPLAVGQEFTRRQRAGEHRGRAVLPAQGMGGPCRQGVPRGGIAYVDAIFQSLLSSSGARLASFPT